MRSTIRIAAIATLALCAPAQAQTLIRCTSPGKGPVTITLDEKRQFGRTLSCISGDFVADMEPCAPNGGVGMSRPTGTAGLVAVSMRWQDATDHNGGVVSHWSNATEIAFHGAFRFFGKASDEWSFTTDRISGKAILESAGKKTAYACSAAKRKF